MGPPKKKRPLIQVVAPRLRQWQEAFFYFPADISLIFKQIQNWCLALSFIDFISLSHKNACMYPIVKVSVLVIYCCITSYPNFCVFGQHLLFSVSVGQESG